MNIEERSKVTGHIDAIAALLLSGKGRDVRADATIAELLRQVREVVSSTYGAEDIRVERDRLRQEARARVHRAGRGLNDRQLAAKAEKEAAL